MPQRQTDHVTLEVDLCKINYLEAMLRLHSKIKNDATIFNTAAYERLIILFEGILRQNGYTSQTKKIPENTTLSQVLVKLIAAFQRKMHKLNNNRWFISENAGVVTNITQYRRIDVDTQALWCELNFLEQAQKVNINLYNLVIWTVAHIRWYFGIDVLFDSHRFDSAVWIAMDSYIEQDEFTEDFKNPEYYEPMVSDIYNHIVGIKKRKGYNGIKKQLHKLLKEYKSNRLIKETIGWILQVLSFSNNQLHLSDFDFPETMSDVNCKLVNYSETRMFLWCWDDDDFVWSYFSSGLDNQVNEGGLEDPLLHQEFDPEISDSLKIEQLDSKPYEDFAKNLDDLLISTSKLFTKFGKHVRFREKAKTKVPKGFPAIIPHDWV